MCTNKGGFETSYLSRKVNNILTLFILLGLPPEGKTHHCNQKDEEDTGGPDHDGQADHGIVFQLLLPHGTHKNAVAVSERDEVLTGPYIQIPTC